MCFVVMVVVVVVVAAAEEEMVVVALADVVVEGVRSFVLVVAVVTSLLF